MTDPATLTLHFNSPGRYDEEIKACELSVLASTYGDTPDLHEEHYGRYAEQMHFLGVRHSTHGMVAFARLMRPGPLELCTYDEIAVEPWGVDPDKVRAEIGLPRETTWDIATFGVRRDLGVNVFPLVVALYHGLFKVLDANGSTHFIGILDRAARKAMELKGLYMQTMPGTGPKEFMGSAACTPVYGENAVMRAGLLARSPEMHRALTEGIGVPGLVPVDSAEFVVTTTTKPVVLDITHDASKTSPVGY